MTEWISTKKVMEMLGVGSTTVKRWSDEGTLPFVRTAGGHRRFRRSDVRRLLAPPGTDAADSKSVTSWLGILRDDNTRAIRQKITQLVNQYDSWFEVADFLGQVITDIGRGWADGELSVVDEHIVSTKIEQSLAAVANDFALPPHAPVGLLATTTGERHTLGLSLVQLCLRSASIDTVWVSGDVPVSDLVPFIRSPDNTLHLVALSASRWQSDYVTLGRAYREIAIACRDRGIELVIGGSGPWPEERDYGHRFHTFSEFGQTLEKLNLPSASQRGR